MRTADIKRKTAETDILLALNLDGTGQSDVQTGCGFLDHMLTLFARHGRFDLKVKCRPLFYLVALMVRLRAGFAVDEYSTVEAMKRNRLPILFLHGTGDKFVPCQMTVRAHEACTAEKTLLLIEDATHGTSYLKEPETCRQALSGFLKKYTREG